MKFIRKAIRSFFLARGFAIFEIHRRNIAAKYQRQGFFALLQRLGFQPKHIIDIGTNHGYWSRDFQRYFPSVGMTLVEPNASLKPFFEDLLASSNCTWVKAGAGLEPGTMTFTVAERDDSSSFVISEEEANRRGLRRETIDIVSVNSMIQSGQSPVPDLIKIDAEGLDVDVIHGATEALGKTEIVCVEVAILGGKNKDTALANVMEVMQGYGYVLMDFTESNRTGKNRALWLMEACFALKDSPLLKDISYEN